MYSKFLFVSFIKYSLFVILFIFFTISTFAIECDQKNLPKFESILCNDSSIKILDDSLNLIYRKLTKIENDLFKQSLKKDQINWLYFRDEHLISIFAIFNVSKTKDAIKHMYLDRINAFNSILNSLIPIIFPFGGTGSIIEQTESFDYPEAIINGIDNLHFTTTIDSINKEAGFYNNILAFLEVYNMGKETRFKLKQLENYGFYDIYIHKLWKLPSLELFLVVNFDHVWNTCCSSPENKKRMIFKINNMNKVQLLGEYDYGGGGRAVPRMAGSSSDSKIEYVTSIGEFLIIKEKKTSRFWDYDDPEITIDSTTTENYYMYINRTHGGIFQITTDENDNYIFEKIRTE